jgi:phage gpG-like protein
MPTTYQLKSHDELQEVYDALAEDIYSTDYHDWLLDELLRMTELHKTYFNRQAGPDGAKWAKNAPSTIRQKGHSKVLRGHPSNNFRLSRSLTELHSQSTGDAIREITQEGDGEARLKFGTFVEYSGFHDRDRLSGRGNIIPARPHVGLTEQHVNGMINRLADHIITELAK